MPTQQLNRLAGLLTSAYSANRFADESDGDLLDRGRAGADPAAFEAIVRRHGGRVLAACRKVLADSADVDDAFQATFLTLLRNPRAVRKAASLGAGCTGSPTGSPSGPATPPSAAAGCSGTPPSRPTPTRPTCPGRRRAPPCT